MSRRRSFPLLSLVLVVLTCLTMLAPVTSLAEDRAEAPDSTEFNPKVESESPPQQNTQPDDSIPQPTMPDANDPQPTEPQEQPEQSQPEIQLRAPWLSVNGAQSALDVADTTPLVAIAASLNDGAAYSLTVSGGHGCGGGQQYELGTGGQSGQLTAELGVYAVGTYSFQAVDATNGVFSNCVNVTVLPVFVEEPTDEPPVTEIPPTEISTEELVPTEEVATETPTNEPATATIEAPTSEPTAEGSPTAPPAETSASPTSEAEASPSAAASPSAEAESNFELIAAESGGLLVNGTTGPLAITTSINVVVYVPDMIESDQMTIDEIFAGLPEPDSNDFRSWRHTGKLTGSPGLNCVGASSTWSLAGHFSPDGSASFSLGTQPAGTRSFRVVSKLEVNLDDDKGWIDRLVVTSNCVNVTITNAQLTVNGSSSEVTLTESDPLTINATGLPEVASHKFLTWSSGCGIGTLALYTAYGPGTSIDAYLGTLSQRTSWFQINSYIGATNVGATNCVKVTITGVPATLKVNGSFGPLSVVHLQELNLFSEGFPPSASVDIVKYGGSGCNGGYITEFDIGVSSSFGMFEYVLANPYPSNWSMALRASGEFTNCVSLVPNQTDPSLTANGSPGPIPIRVGDEITLVASNLPEGRPGFLHSYDSAGCNGTGILSALGTTAGGTVELAVSPAGSDAYSYRVVVDGISTNCLLVRVYEDLADPPQLTANESVGPVAVTTGEVIRLLASQFQPDAAIQIHSFAGSSDCTGTAGTISELSNVQGEVDLDFVIPDPGTTSFLATFLNDETNCVVVNAVAPVDPGPGPEPPPIVQPDPETPRPTQTPGGDVDPDLETPRATIVPGGDPTGPSTTPDPGTDPDPQSTSASSDPAETLDPLAEPTQPATGLPVTGSTPGRESLPRFLLVTLALVAVGLAAMALRTFRRTARH